MNGNENRKKEAPVCAGVFFIEKKNKVLIGDSIHIVKQDELSVRRGWVWEIGYCYCWGRWLSYCC